MEVLCEYKRPSNYVFFLWIILLSFGKKEERFLQFLSSFLQLFFLPFLFSFLQPSFPGVLSLFLQLSVLFSVVRADTVEQTAFPKKSYTLHFSRNPCWCNLFKYLHSNAKSATLKHASNVGYLTDCTRTVWRLYRCKMAVVVASELGRANW